jgi:hypothetical protein
MDCLMASTSASASARMDAPEMKDAPEEARQKVAGT